MPSLVLTNNSSYPRAIDAHTEHTLMIGDRMDTDIVAGLEAGLRMVLVLSGISTADSVTRFPTAHTWWWTRSPIWSAGPTTRSAAVPPGGGAAGRGRPAALRRAGQRRFGVEEDAATAAQVVSLTDASRVRSGRVRLAGRALPVSGIRRGN
ncbi:MAG: HAD hydrolase-like protein, partial [Pseudonocardiaceae bacterium]